MGKFERHTDFDITKSMILEMLTCKLAPGGDYSPNLLVKRH
jgi:hypothetical protein